MPTRSIYEETIVRNPDHFSMLLSLPGRARKAASDSTAAIYCSPDANSEKNIPPLKKHPP
jgi:hypothetical protein